MTHLHLDIETYSETNLLKTGAYKYAECPTTELTHVCYAFGNGPVHHWFPYSEVPPRVLAEVAEQSAGEIHTGMAVPADLDDHIAEGGEVRAHNAEFERTVLNGTAGARHAFPHISISQTVCTAAKAAACNIPRALSAAAQTLGTAPKDDDGKAAMLALCKPRTGKTKRWDLDTAPDKFITQALYCADDVSAERGIDQRLPDLIPQEQAMYELDQTINQRGIPIDLDLARAAVDLRAQRGIDLRERCLAITGHTPGQVSKLLTWLEQQDVFMPDLRAPTVAEALTWDTLNDDTREVLNIRMESASTACSKFDALLRATCSNGRLHGAFVFHGASTGRWAGKLFQPQNLMRPVIKDIDRAIAVIKSGNMAELTGYDATPVKVMASCVRAAVRAPTGKRLMAFDYSGVESAGLNWMSNCEPSLEVIRSGLCLYTKAAAGIYRKAYEDITKDERQIGKIAVLALGYQGGYRALLKMASAYGVTLDEVEAGTIVQKWRATNPEIVKLWAKAESAVSSALIRPGTTAKIDMPSPVYVKLEDEFLKIRLPSARVIRYYKATLEQGKIMYTGTNSMTRKVERMNLYGGTIVQSITQALCRDLLANGLEKVSSAGFDVVMHVHDEVVMQVDEDNPRQQEARDLFVDVPEWAAGLPLTSDEGYVAERYRK